MNAKFRWLEVLAMACLLGILTTPLAGASGSGSDPEPIGQPADPVGESEWPEDEPVDSLIEARDLYNDGVKKMEKAKKQWQEAKTDKDRAKAVKSFEKAAETYAEALKFNPNYPEALNNLAFSLRVSGRYGEAMAHYNRAIELRPDFMQAHEYRARAFLALDSVAQAQTEYQWLIDHKHQGEADTLKLAIDAWVLAKAEGRKVSVEKLGW